jgi:hypothetical protein
MTVTLYNTSSSYNTLGKSKSAVGQPVTAQAKGAVDVDNPTLILAYNSVNFNYFYVSEFGRYYNVISRSLNPGRQVIVTGESDPLESFVADVAALEPLIVRAEDPEMRSPYITDNAIPIPTDPQYEVIDGEEIISSLSSGMYVIGVV